MDHLTAEKNENNEDSQKGQVTPKICLKKHISDFSAIGFNAET